MPIVDLDGLALKSVVTLDGSDEELTVETVKLSGQVLTKNPDGLTLWVFSDDLNFLRGPDEDKEDVSIILTGAVEILDEDEADELSEEEEAAAEDFSSVDEEEAKTTPEPAKPRKTPRS